jgi:Protein of unknown function (DUF2524)
VPHQEGGTFMATRASMETLSQQVEETIRFAEEQYKQSSMQEHYNENDYIEALQRLEQTYQDIATMAHSANGQQREQLHRMRLQIQQMQNNMILQGTRGGEQ